MTDQVTARPQIGFLVEGRGEFESYISLATRALGRTVYMQRQVAGSCGEIIRNLESQLTTFIVRYHPVNIIIALDLRDLLRTGEVASCAELREKLQDKVNAWLSSPKTDLRLDPLPQRISLVIQVQCFESWLLAHTERLVDLGYLRPDTPQVADTDAIDNPVNWLERNHGRLKYRKVPPLVKRIVSELDPNVMRLNSHSFNKLCRETEALAA